MVTRRRALKHLLSLVLACFSFFSQANLAVRQSLAKGIRKIIEKGTPLSKLMHANPARIDTSNLETTPIENFDVMGETTHSVDIDSWYLHVEGAIQNSVKFSYEELTNRPVLERNALLICPGFFAYNGHWKGFSVAALLKETGLEQGATHVKFSGSAGFRKKSKRFNIDEVMSDKIFIAYEVNDLVLPQRHGYPMRLVAEEHRGHRWIKYLNRIEVI